MGGVVDSQLKVGAIWLDGSSHDFYEFDPFEMRRSTVSPMSE